MFKFVIDQVNFDKQVWHNLYCTEIASYPAMFFNAHGKNKDRPRLHRKVNMLHMALVYLIYAPRFYIIDLGSYYSVPSAHVHHSAILVPSISLPFEYSGQWSLTDGIAYTCSDVYLI